MRISDWSSDVCSSDLQIAATARAAGIRMLGPNCLGFANFVAGTPIWTTQLRRASGTLQVAIVSQSGALASQLEQFAYQQRVGLTHMISTGNEADVQVADAIEYLARQPEPKAIALFPERSEERRVGKGGGRTCK